MKRPGFTLIELMVTVSIIGIIVTASMAGYFNSEKKSNLDGGMRMLSANFNLARNDFLSGVKYAGAVPVGGWGIHLDKSSSTYLLFADLNNNGLYDAGESDAGFGGREFDLGKNLSFSTIDLGDQLDTVFFGINTPKASIMSGANSSSTACVEVTETVSGRVAGFKINAFGFYEIVNSCQ